MKKIISYYLTVIMLVLMFGQAFVINSTTTYAKTNSWPTAPDLVGETAILIEPNSGTILYEKNSHKKMYPASITKIMTALLTIENCKMNEKVVYSKQNINSIQPGDANIGCQIGEEMTVKDCLYALMLSSANETARALAEHISGSCDAFAQLMNERAKQAGAKDTHFANPNGLHDPNHYVTAYDMAMIMKAAIKYPVFLYIIHTTEYTLPKNNKRKTPYPSYQRHKMIYSTSEYYDPDVVGGKTGYTDQAGKTLVTYAKRGDLDLISVVMKSKDEQTIFTDTRKLLDYGFNNFQYVNVSKNDTRFDSDTDTLLKSPFSTDIANIVIDSSASILVPKNTKVSDLDTKVTFKSDGDSFARITYKYGDKVLGTAKIKYLTSESKNKESTESSTTVTTTTNNVKETVASQKQNTTKVNKETSKSDNTNSNLELILPILIIIIIIVVIIFIFAMQRRKINRVRAMKRNRNR